MIHGLPSVELQIFDTGSLCRGWDSGSLVHRIRGNLNQSPLVRANF